MVYYHVDQIVTIRIPLLVYLIKSVIRVIFARIKPPVVPKEKNVIPIQINVLNHAHYPIPKDVVKVQQVLLQDKYVIKIRLVSKVLNVDMVTGSMGQVVNLFVLYHPILHLVLN